MRKGLVLHCDLDSFFASVEQAVRPELTGKPVAVSAARGQNIITAASYEAKRLGVRVGVPLRDARAMCPGLQFVFARMEAYQRAGSYVQDLIRSLGVEIETLGIDECFLETSGVKDEVITGGPAIKGNEYERAEVIATWIREKIKTRTGMNISIGGGTNKTVAKLASDSSKPNGLMIIPKDQELAFLHKTELKEINGIGPRSWSKLASIGLFTVGDVAKHDAQRLKMILGKRQGHVVYQISRNIFDEGVNPNPKPKTTSATRSYGKKGNNAREALEDMLSEVLARLEKTGRSTRYVYVFASDGVHGYQGKRDLRAPTADLRELAATARTLIRRVPKNFVASIAGVTFDGLSDAEQLKLELDLPWMSDTALSEPVEQPVYDQAEQLKRAAFKGMVVAHPSFGEGMVSEINEYEVIIQFKDKVRSMEYWAPLAY